MKTKHFFLLTSFFFFGAISNGNAQATQASNTLTAVLGQPTVTNSYIGSANNFDVVFKRQGVFAGVLSTGSLSLGLNTPTAAIGTGTCIGSFAGQFTTGSGAKNTFIGDSAGKGQSTLIPNTGGYNTFIGKDTGGFNTTGSSNTFVGTSVGGLNSTGSNNTYIGIGSGQNSNGSNNVFIGKSSGANETNSNKLYIENSISATPLIWGDFAADEVKLNGKVGIGTVGAFPTVAGGVSVSTYKLFVTGGILTEEVRINASAGGTTWADYVFNKDYNLKSLSEVEKYINENGHLPNVPSAARVKEDGIALGEMAKIQQEKIEELTLYIIEQNKVNEKQGEEIAELKKLMIEVINKK